MLKVKIVILMNIFIIMFLTHNIVNADKSLNSEKEKGVCENDSLKEIIELINNGIMDSAFIKLKDFKILPENDSFWEVKNFQEPHRAGLEITIKKKESVLLILFDSDKKVVKICFNMMLSEGNYIYIFNGKDNFQNELMDGEYISYLKIGNKIKKEEIFLLR